MIDHDVARVSLVDLVVPGLGDPTRTAALRGHVAACDACQEELADLEHLHRALRAAGSAPRPPDQLRRRVLAVPRRRRDAPGNATAWRTAAILLGGACAFLAVLFAIVLLAA